MKFLQKDIWFSSKNFEGEKQLIWANEDKNIYDNNSFVSKCMLLEKYQWVSKYSLFFIHLHL